MDKRKFFALFSVISTSALAMAVVFAAKPDISNLTLMSRGANTYSCNDIVFSETVNNPGSYTDIPDLSAEGVTTLNCSMTEWTNANYLKNKNSSMSDSAIKIGGSSAGKYSGSVKSTLNNGMTASKAIVYSTGWYGDTGDIKLGVNGSYQTIANTSDSYVFSPYTFDFTETDTITFSNDPEASGKRRLVISKIVLRLYGEQSGSGGGGDTPIDPPTPITESVTLLPDNSASVAADNIGVTKDGVSLVISNGIINSSQFRVYKGKTLTISSASLIKSIVFTCTASGTAQYGPGCFVTDSGYTYSGTAGTWEGESTSVTFTASTNQVRITQVVVNF